jgi:hypothetical protein
MKEWIIIALLLVVLLLILKRRVSGLRTGITCSACPEKAAGTYYLDRANGCATAPCGSLANCPDVANATKTITPCADPIAGVADGSPGNCGFTCNSGYTQSGNGCVAAKNCAVSWGNWGACSVNCGAGFQTRTGTITQQPEPGGQACPASLTESQACTGTGTSCPTGGGPGQNKEDKLYTSPAADTTAADTVAVTTPFQLPAGFSFSIESILGW